MDLKWKANWYELDQAIVVGDIDYFYLTKDNNFFASDLDSLNELRVVKAKIQKITHPELGDVKGIITFGLSYKIYLADGNEITVDAEERPGAIEHSTDTYIVNQWIFDIQIDLIEELQMTKEDYINAAKANKQRLTETKKKYKELLGLTEVPWDWQ